MKRLQAVAKHQRGISLIELVIFMVIVGVALAGIVSAINYNVQHSADAVVKKQALAIAESLLEEVEGKPFTFCDPDDVNVSTAASPAACIVPEVFGPETIAGKVETRYATPFFDNVSDYDGFNMASGAIRDITNSPLGLNGYAATVNITEKALNGMTLADSLSIIVTVTGPLNTTVVLEGYRTRYVPNEVW